jgi:hypothetical protein
MPVLLPGALIAGFSFVDKWTVYLLRELGRHGNIWLRVAIFGGAFWKRFLEARMTRRNAAGQQVKVASRLRFGNIILAVAAALCLAASAAPVPGQSWSFALIGDSRSATRDYTAALRYMRDARNAAGQSQGLPEFVVAVGDFDPVDTNYALFRSIFSGFPVPRFLPVIGNHDLSHRRFIHDTILPKEGIHDPFDKSAVSYYVDVRNVRLIVVDQYQGTGFKSGCVNDAGIRWIEQAIVSGGSADHIPMGAPGNVHDCRGRRG